MTAVDEAESLTLTQATDASMDGIAILDADGRYIYVSDAHASTYGCDHPDELPMPRHPAAVPGFWRMGGPLLVRGVEPSAMPADVPRLDTDSRSYRYYRNAVERQWDPHAIDLATDRERAAALPDAAFESLRRTLALFGAGEQAVTEDLAPLAVVLDDPADQLFVASQLSDEAKHADFFDRYWREVVAPAERGRGLDPTDPTADRWFSPEYAALFERTADAMARLLTADTPGNRAAAYAHYHLTVEGVLAQTGYYGVQRSFSGEISELPALPGLVEGFRNIRGDEGRHVGFGMAKLTELVRAGEVAPASVEETVSELLPLVQATVDSATVPDAAGVDDDELATYALERHADRMDQLGDGDAELPSVEELVDLE